VKREHFKNCKERLETLWKAKDSASRGKILTVRAVAAEEMKAMNELEHVSLLPVCFTSE
jgi:hypothetical protein